MPPRPGAAVRPEDVARLMPPEIAHRVYQAHKRFYDNVRKDIAGSRDKV